LIKHILFVLAVGLATGYFASNFVVAFPLSWVTYYLFDVSLLVLLFVMGLAFGVDREAVAKLRSTGLKVLVIPLLVALGSIFGGLVGGLIFGLDLFGSMAVNAGFGWYTLAGPLLTQVLGSQWGALGFVANFLRELLTIVSVSLMVKVDKYAPVASGGATTMDTTLPVIVRYCGKDVLIVAFSSGFALSIAAPFVVMAIASLK
jgi:uncharacterized membrane protein YbjE (DUF340 family)